MPVETIIEHDKPDFEPGNPSPQTRSGAGLPAQATAAIDEVLRVLFLMSLPALGDQAPPEVLASMAIAMWSWNHERSHADF